MFAAVLDCRLLISVADAWWIMRPHHRAVQRWGVHGTTQKQAQRQVQAAGKEEG
jgi:hypothetical protein